MPNLERMTDIRNKYLKIRVQQPTDRDEYFYLRVGMANEQENTASWLVEVKDWAGKHRDRFLRNVRTLDQLQFADLNLEVFYNAQEITEAEFHSAVIQTIIDQAKEQLEHRHEAFMINFKQSEDRRALMGHILNKAVLTGVTI
jgi:hypothetical protein